MSVGLEEGLLGGRAYLTRTQASSSDQRGVAYPLRLEDASCGLLKVQTFEFDREQLATAPLRT